MNKKAHYADIMRSRGTRYSLFEACWRKLTKYLREGAIDPPAGDDEVIDFLEAQASELVNNPKSKYWIHG